MQVSDDRRFLVNVVMNSWVPYTDVNFLNNCMTCGFVRMTVVGRVNVFYNFFFHLYLNVNDGNIGS